VIGEHVEVVDKQLRQVLGFLLPFGYIRVGIPWVENALIAIVQKCRDFQVEHRQVLCFRMLNRTIEDGVDDRTGILD